MRIHYLHTFLQDAIVALGGCDKTGEWCLLEIHVGFCNSLICDDEAYCYMGS